MSRFANLSERLSADLPEDPTRPEVGEEDETTTSTSKDKEKKDMSNEIDQAKAEGHAAGFKEANDRMNKVFASEHYEGREKTAQTLLGKNMSADDIIDVLATTPKIEQSSSDASVEADAEAAARNEMKDAIAQTSNSSVEASGSASNKKDETSAQVWDQALANIIPASAS